MSEAHSIDTLSDEAFGWYLTGFTDGEGCFSFSEKTSLRLNGSARRRWESAFSIGLRADDEPILIALRRRLGCGSITSYCSNGGAGRASRWVVGSLRDLTEIVIPHFERFPLLAKKANDFAIWKEATVHMRSMSLRRKGQWKRGDRIATDADHEYLSRLRAELTATRAFAMATLF